MAYLSKIIQLDQSQFTKLLSGQNISQNGYTLNSYDINASYVFDKFVSEWSLGAERAIRSDTANRSKVSIKSRQIFAKNFGWENTPYYDDGYNYGRTYVPFLWSSGSCTSNVYFTIRYDPNIYYDFEDNNSNGTTGTLTSPYFKSTAPEMNVQTSFDRVYVSNDSVIRWKSKDRFIAEIIAVGSFDNRFVLKAGDTMTGDLKISGTKNLSHGPWDKGVIAGADGHDKVVLTYLASSTNGAVVGAHNSNLSAWAILNISGTQLIFRNSETEQMRLNASGNFGIGTASPAYKLHVNGRIFATNNTNGIHLIPNADCGIYMTSSGQWIHIAGSGSSMFIYNGAWDNAGTGNYNKGITINTSNNIGIGTTSPSYKLDINGDIRIQGNDEYLGTGSGSQCHMQYDNTNKCLNFIFD